MAAGDNANATTVAAMIKKLYPQIRIEQMWKQKFPLLAELKKVDEGDGSSIEVPVEHDHPAVSSDFAQAQANRAPTKSVAWSITTAETYAVGRIKPKTMRQMRNRKGGFVELLDNEVSNTIAAVQKRIAYGLYRTQDGWLAQVASVSANDVTLKNKTDVVAFAKDFKLIASPNSSGASPRSGDMVVQSINLDTGVIAVDAAAASLAANDYLFIKGDDKTAYAGFMQGLRDWVPPSAPGATLFNNVNRSVSPQRLGGHRVTDTSLSISQAIDKAAYLISLTGGMANRCYGNPLQLRQLSQELDTQVVRDPGGVGLTGFAGFKVLTAVGEIAVMPDPACPEDVMYVGDISKAKIVHLDPLPHLVTDDTLRVTRVGDADLIEFRIRAWPQLAITNPGHWCHITRTAVL